MHDSFRLYRIDVCTYVDVVRGTLGDAKAPLGHEVRKLICRLFLKQYSGLETLSELHSAVSSVYKPG